MSSLELERRIQRLEQLISDIPAQPNVIIPTNDPSNTIIGTYQEKVRELSNIKNKDISHFFTKRTIKLMLVEDAQEILSLQVENSSLLTPLDLDIMVQSCVDELEYLEKQLSELKLHTDVLDIKFEGLDKCKQIIANITKNSPQEQVEQNYKKLVHVLSEANEYYVAVSKLFTGYHLALESIERKNI
jgi:hypothetical protein